MLSWGNTCSGGYTTPETSMCRTLAPPCWVSHSGAPSLCPASAGAFIYGWAHNLPPPRSSFVKLPYLGPLPGDLVPSFVKVSLYVATLK